MDPVVRNLVRIVAGPGFEKCIDECRIFRTIFEHPDLDPLTVAKKIWDENRPLVLAQLFCSSKEHSKEEHKSTSFIRRGTFPFLDLPRELRDKIYVHLLEPTVNVKDLTGQTSDWFDPAVLGINRQLHSEASIAIYGKQINVALDPMAMACYKTGVYKMPEMSGFKRCRIDIDFSDPRLTRFRHKTTQHDRRKAVQDIIHLLVEGLKRMKSLEEIHISCKRVTVSNRSSTTKGDMLLFPDSTMDCFRKLKGLKKITIDGDLDGAYIDDLLTYMRKIPFDWRTSCGRVRYVPRSRCLACSSPDEEYFQADDDDASGPFVLWSDRDRLNMAKRVTR